MYDQIIGDEICFARNEQIINFGFASRLNTDDFIPVDIAKRERLKARILIGRSNFLHQIACDRAFVAAIFDFGVDLPADFGEIRSTSRLKLLPESFSCRDHITLRRWELRIRHCGNFPLRFLSPENTDGFYETLSIGQSHEDQFITGVDLFIDDAPLRAQFGDQAKAQQEMLYVLCQSIADGRIRHPRLIALIDIDRAIASEQTVQEKN